MDRLSPRFIRGVKGDLFTIVHLPREGATLRGNVVFIPPFAEELNRCRRMMSLQAKQLADIGFEVWVFDLFGTGDSQGDFQDADLSTWIMDTQLVLDRAVVEANGLPMTVIAVRFGALLVQAALGNLDYKPVNLIMWQPVLQGLDEIRQLERLHRFSGAFQSGREFTGNDLLARAREGCVMELAGYPIAAKLLIEISELRLEEFGPEFESVCWIEVTSPMLADISSRRRASAKALLGVAAVDSLVIVSGEKFWNTIEIAVAHEVLDHTLDQLEK